MGHDIFGEGELHEYYPLKEPLLISNQWFNEVDIWQHYKEQHKYLTDEDILQFVKQLHNTNYPINKIGYLKTSDGRMWRTYYKIFHLENKAYLLAWYIEDSSDMLHILHCYRRHKCDLKGK